MNQIELWVLIALGSGLSLFCIYRLSMRLTLLLIPRLYAWLIIYNSRRLKILDAYGELIPSTLKALQGKGEEIDETHKGKADRDIPDNG